MPDFDPNTIGNTNNNIFGLPYTPDTAMVVFIPIPWEVTVSYNPGTADAPEAVFNASFQVDLSDPFKENAWTTGYAMTGISDEIKSRNEKLKPLSFDIIQSLSEGKNIASDPQLQKKLSVVNQGCTELNSWVEKETKKYIDRNKLIGIIGGDHSVPLGFLQTLASKHKNFGIMQIDAHADLREAYEGFTFSHASIMHNALKIPQISKLVQLGIRDYCREEYCTIEQSAGRIRTFFDREVKHQLFEGKTWKSICDEIIQNLPEMVYISFDVDGLDPKLCKSTGTPVPGGYDLPEIFYLLESIVNSGKKIIGFDLCEACPGDFGWDANVASRILYKLANIMSKSNNI
ncbi:MAG: agmatinase family protein [Bacteroidota bacterium]